MLQSLRTRLAVLFAGALILAAAIAVAASVRLYQSYNRDQTETDLRGQVAGIAAYYTRAADATLKGSKSPPLVTAATFERASGARLFYAGPPLFPNAPASFRIAGLDVRWKDLQAGDTRTVNWVPKGEDRTFLGVETPVTPDFPGQKDETVGAVLLAKPLTDINSAWTNVITPVAGGIAIGLLVAFLLSTFFARRITRPLSELGAAADRVARGDLSVNVVVSGTQDDELGQLAIRFQTMVNRLREVDELERNFLMRITHELRTPLTAISGHVQAIEEGVVGPEDLDDSLAAVNEEVRRLDRLVGDLLDLTRLEAHQFRLVTDEVGLEALLEQAAGAFREKARTAEIGFDTRTSGAPSLVTDADRVLQIVTNLLDNAFRWTPRGGKVTLSHAERDSVAAIQVCDTGPGIAESDLEAVFHPFYSRRGEGGTGLGLSISRELAHALGGRLTVESELGRGSTFTLTLPRQQRRGKRRRPSTAQRAHR